MKNNVSGYCTYNNILKFFLWSILVSGASTGTKQTNKCNEQMDFVATMQLHSTCNLLHISTLCFIFFLFQERLFQLFQLCQISVSTIDKIFFIKRKSLIFYKIKLKMSISFYTIDCILQAYKRDLLYMNVNSVII